jgi:hypothetical protein
LFFGGFAKIQTLKFQQGLYLLVVLVHFTSPLS